MSDYQELLQALANFFENKPNSTIDDIGISQAFKSDIHEARVWMQELSRKGYIKLVDASSLKGECWVIIGLKPEGWVAAKSIK